MKRFALLELAMLFVFVCAFAKVPRHVPASGMVGCDSVWVTDYPDSTVYKRRTCTTQYDSAVKKIDTVWVVDTTTTSVTMTDSVVHKRPPVAGAFPYGFFAYPEDDYGDGITTGVARGLAPNLLLSRLRMAQKAKMAIVIFTPRTLLTTDGTQDGLFSPTKANALMDSYAKVLPPDSLKKYRNAIVGVSLGDDYNCTKTCWGGKGITQQQVYNWAKYARSKLPGMPFGIRVVPSWLDKDPALGKLIAAQVDFAWASYNTPKGDPAKYFNDAATDAKRYGLKMVMGLNSKNCYGGSTSTCSPVDLTRFGTLAVDNPVSCAFINWEWEEHEWPALRTTWTALFARAAKRPPTSCGVNGR